MPAPGGSILLLDLAAVRHHRELVARTTDHLREHHSCSRSLVQLRDGHAVRAIALHHGLAYQLGISAPQLKGSTRQAPRIQHHPHLLRAFRCELPRHQLAAPRRRRPRNAPQLITLLKVPEALKLTPRPAQLQFPPLQFNLPRAQKKERCPPPAVLVRRKHTRPRRLLCPGERLRNRPSLHQLQRSAIPKKHLAQREVTALRRPDRLRTYCLFARKNLNALHLRLRNQRRMQTIDDPRLDHRVSLHP